MSAFDGDPGVRPSKRSFVAYAAAWEPIPDDGLERFAESAHPPALVRRVAQRADQRQRQQHHDHHRGDGEHVDAVLDRDGDRHRGEQADEDQAADQQRVSQVGIHAPSTPVARLGADSRPAVGERPTSAAPSEQAAGQPGERRLADRVERLQPEPDGAQDQRRDLDEA